MYQYRVEWFGDDARVYEYDDNYDAYMFVGAATVVGCPSDRRTESQIAIERVTGRHVERDDYLCM